MRAHATALRWASWSVLLLLVAATKRAAAEVCIKLNCENPYLPCLKKCTDTSCSCDEQACQPAGCSAPGCKTCIGWAGGCEYIAGVEVCDNDLNHYECFQMGPACCEDACKTTPAPPTPPPPSSGSNGTSGGSGSNGSSGGSSGSTDLTEDQDVGTGASDEEAGSNSQYKIAFGVGVLLAVLSSIACVVLIVLTWRRRRQQLQQQLPISSSKAAPAAATAPGAVAIDLKQQQQQQQAYWAFPSAASAGGPPTATAVRVYADATGQERAPDLGWPVLHCNVHSSAPPAWQPQACSVYDPVMPWQPRGRR